ncbi:MAG: hypothetical protein M5U34_19935 [Chloroflexi bacterium]|nr:hypothetical protein [Chloroflexota bacterium]
MASAAPGYSYETTQTAWHILSDYLIPLVLGKALQEPEDVTGWLRSVRGHPLAKAALDQAAWDITAQRDKLSLAQKLAEPYAESAQRARQSGHQHWHTTHHRRHHGRDRREFGQRLRPDQAQKIKPGHDLQNWPAPPASISPIP